MSEQRDPAPLSRRSRAAQRDAQLLEAEIARAAGYLHKLTAAEAEIEKLKSTLAASPSPPAGGGNDLVSRSEVIRVLRRLGNQDADLALYGAADNARAREYGEAAATRACCAVAMMPPAGGGEPVAWQGRSEDGRAWEEVKDPDYFRRCGWQVRPLYTSPDAAQQRIRELEEEVARLSAVNRAFQGGMIDQPPLTGHAEYTPITIRARTAHGGALT